MHSVQTFIFCKHIHKLFILMWLIAINRQTAQYFMYNMSRAPSLKCCSWRPTVLLRTPPSVIKQIIQSLTCLGESGFRVKAKFKRQRVCKSTNEWPCFQAIKLEIQDGPIQKVKSFRRQTSIKSFRGLRHYPNYWRHKWTRESET